MSRRIALRRVVAGRAAVWRGLRLLWPASDGALSVERAWPACRATVPTV